MSSFVPDAFAGIRPLAFHGRDTDVSIESFSLGALVATPEALEAFARNGTSGLEYLQEHARGKWGEVRDS